LADEASRAYFDRVTSFYRTLDARYLTPQPKRIGQYGYDAPGANPTTGARIVDCGSFTGDSFPDFLAATDGNCLIYALEAFPPNFERLMAGIVRDKLADIVNPPQVALAREAGTVQISGDPAIADGGARSGAGKDEHGYTVAGDTLDNLFLSQYRTRIDYLKMDIEGAELDALMGGRLMLRCHRPVVAVAAYHKPEHLIEIADFLMETLAPCKLYAAHDPQLGFPYPLYRRTRPPGRAFLLAR
jgi:FkbM family methyltransferase